MDGKPWRPEGRTHLISGIPTPLSATKMGGPTDGLVDYFVYNCGASDGWIGFGMTSDAAVANAVAPLITASTAAIAAPVGVPFIVRLQARPFVAASSTGLGSTNISITPGQGGY